MSNSQAIVSSSLRSTLPSNLSEPIIEKLDDVAIAACSGISIDEIDAEEVTLVSVLIDGSWSMRKYRDDVINEYNNSFLKALQGAKNADSILVSMMYFANGQTKLIHNFKPISQCSPLTANDYDPDGDTPLYKAAVIGMTGIWDYGNTLIGSGVRLKRIVLLVSDGGENSSKSFTKATVKSLSNQLLDTESCVLSYIFLGDENEGDQYAEDIGFPPEHRLKEDIRKSGGEKACRRIFGTASASVISTSQSTITNISANNFFVNP